VQPWQLAFKDAVQGVSSRWKSRPGRGHDFYAWHLSCSDSYNWGKHEKHFAMNMHILPQAF